MLNASLHEAHIKGRLSHNEGKLCSLEAPER
jgi:hypothetical protein